MGLLNRIFGMEAPQAGARESQPQRRSPEGSDAHALERYRYMLQTAPPETIEQAHAEAFEKLTPEQRRQVLAELAASAPPNERGALERVSPDDPQALGRAATRAEIRQPGIMERTLGTSPGRGFGAGLLGSFAAGFAGSMVANSFFSALGGFDGFGGDGNEDASAADGTDASGGAEDATHAGAGDVDGTLAGVGDIGGDLDDGGGFDGGDFDV